MTSGCRRRRDGALPGRLALVLLLALHRSFAVATRQATTALPQTSDPVTPATPPHPERGIYNVTGDNGTVCLMAQMGLQMNVTFKNTQQKTVQEVVNLRPNVTRHLGSCESDRASLILMDEKTNLTFFFSLNSTSKKYHLSGLNMSAFWPEMSVPFGAGNNSLDYIRGTLGYSYMCREEQILSVTSVFSLNTFQLQVQPFAISGDQFAAAEECQLDQDDLLIPIIVGAALAGLVLVVLVAYLIGRKRSHAGYQTI
ncbi:lysosome-associated membrane glycoprotein 1b [Denticeps clupeoides]|nr:lysosome-associated membrane glycoprotein 1-like [Denticeps clupeoides]